MQGASVSALGLPGAPFGGDWFWLLEGRSIEFVLAVMLGTTLLIQIVSWATKR